CHSRPKFVDGSKTHPFCGRTCAAKAPAAANNCDYCHTRPKRHDGIRLHPYCSKTCAVNAEAATRQAPLHHSSHGICRIPGCGKPVHRPATGQPSKYCGLAHKTLAETACIWCRKAPKQGDRHFCGPLCADEARKKGPMIVEIPDDHEVFHSVEAQFKTSWRHGDRVCPTVRRIYKVIAEQSSLDKYDAYRAAVEARGQFVKDGRSAGNENRRWHGTTRECRLGDKGHVQFCSSTKCSLCCIMKTSYDLNLWGKKTGWGRFGAGIYTSSTSSKSNDYSSNVDPNAALKAIILNKVVVGKGYKMTQDNTSLTAPPNGFDSVLAEKGSRLNHDELVVYTNDAIRPSYLVMYDAI
ncbi:ADP-ribosylation, partial [Panus rudis PR-1116 ss-1]